MKKEDRTMEGRIMYIFRGILLNVGRINIELKIDKFWSQFWSHLMFYWVNK